MTMASATPPRKNRNAVHASEIVTRLLQRQGWGRATEHRAVFSAWEEVVPKTIAARTRAVSFRGGRLLVIVDSAPLMQELQCFRQDQFLSLINHHLVARGDSVVVRRLEFKRS